MALPKKVYGVKTAYLAPFSDVHGVGNHHTKSQKTVAAQSEVGNLRRPQLKLQFVSDQGNKFGSQEIAFCVRNGKSGKIP